MSRHCLWCLLGVLVVCQHGGMLLLGDDSDGVPMGVDALPPHAVLRAGSNRFVHGTYIRDMAFLDPKRIVTFGKADAKVWYEPTGQLLVRIADGGEVADRFASGPLALTLTRDPQRSRDVEFRTWNLLSGTSDKSFRHESLVYSASISEDGKLIAVAHTDWSIHLLDGEIGEVLASLPPLDSRVGHGGLPLVHLSGDGSVLVIVDLADPKNNVRRYRFRQVDEGPKIGKELSCVEFQGHCRLKAIEDRDEAIFIGFNGEVLIYDFRDGKEILRVRHGRVSALGAAVDPQHRVLATCGADGYIRMWDIATGTETRAIDTGERHPWCVAFSPDDRTVASGGGHGRVRFWDIATGKETRLREGERHTGGIRSVAISPDGRTMATAGELGLVSLWETRTGRLLGTLQDEEGNTRYDPKVGPNFLAFSPDGQRLAAGSNDRHNSVNIWDVATRRRVTSFPHRWPVTAAVYSADGSRIASACRDGAVRIWTMAGEVKCKIEGCSSLGLAFSPSGGHVAFGSTGPDTRTSKVSMWDVFENHLVQSYLPQADFASALSTAFSPRDGTLASSHADGKIRIWQVGKEEPIRIIGADPEMQFPVHHGPACIAFSPRGKILAAAGDDGAITLWNPDSGQQRMRLVGHDAAVTSLVWHPESGRLISGSLDCTVFVWQLPPELAE